MTDQQVNFIDSENRMKIDARHKATEIKNNLLCYNIPESVDREAIAQDFVTEVLNEMNGFGVNDWLKGKRVEFWEEVQRNI